MAKKLVQNITAREEDFAQWYTDVVRDGRISRRNWMHVLKRQV